MAQNTSCIQMHSCADSPLSITGNIVGILSLAYAIIITSIYISHQLLEAMSDLRDYMNRFEVDFESLRSASDRLAPYVDRLPEPLIETVCLAVQEAQCFCAEYDHELRSLEDLLSQPKRQLIYRSLFVTKKKDLAEKLERAIQMRIKLDGIYNTVIQSIILNEVDILNQRQLEMLHYQRSLLGMATNGPRPPSPDMTVEREGAHSLINGAKSLTILHDYLRPPTQWDPPGPRDAHTCLTNKTKLEGSTDITPSGD